MTAEPAVPPSSAPAVAAFLRGVERRAVVFAELQCGHAQRGDVAVAAALRAFPRVAPATPLADWPTRFWSLLLAAPDLRRTADDALWATPWTTLGKLGNGPRAALLLRLVAALDMDVAAAALGVGEESYRTALQRAIPYRDDGTPDREGWQAWVAEVRARVEGMASERLARLRAPSDTPAGGQVVHAPLRTGTTTHGDARESEPTPRPIDPRLRGDDGELANAMDPRLRGDHGEPASKRPARRTIALAAITLAAAAAVIGTIAFFRPQVFDRVPTRGIRTRVLPPAAEPAARFDADLAAWTHRDFLVVADADGLRRAQALPFFAWYAATLAVRPSPDAATPAAAATVATPAGALAEPATPFLPPPRATPLQAPTHIALPDATAAAIARAPAVLQTELRDQARLWASFPPAQRDEFRRRIARWDAQPFALRAQQRVHYAAWRNLDATSAQAVENAVQVFARQSPEEQARLRAEFDALDPTTQRGWLLGPAIGVDYPKLQPLLAQRPEAQHAPMLRTLRRMTAGERADLAVLAQRVPPQERDALVRDLLSTADANRAAWLRTRLEQ